MGQQIGERVVVAGKGEGTLEYYGRVRRSQTDHGKIMCGVSLDDRVGLNDGTAGVWRYFICDPDHGIFIAPDKVTLFSDYNSPRERVKRAVQAKAAARSRLGVGELRSAGPTTTLGGGGGGSSQASASSERLMEENRRLKLRLNAAKRRSGAGVHSATSSPAAGMWTTSPRTGRKSTKKKGGGSNRPVPTPQLVEQQQQQQYVDLEQEYQEQYTVDHEEPGYLDTKSIVPASSGASRSRAASPSPSQQEFAVEGAASPVSIMDVTRMVQEQLGLSMEKMQADHHKRADEERELREAVEAEKRRLTEEFRAAERLKVRARLLLLSYYYYYYYFIDIFGYLEDIAGVLRSLPIYGEGGGTPAVPPPPLSLSHSAIDFLC